MENPTSAAVPSTDALARDRVVTLSLAGRSDYLLIGISLLAGLLASARLCFPHRFGWPIDHPFGKNAMLFALPIAIGPLMLSLLLIGWVLTPWRRGLELRWLAGLPFPFAHRGYLTVLKRELSANQLQLLLTFTHEPRRSDLEELLRMKLPHSKLVWQDERCVMVRSPASLDSKEPRKGLATASNARLHRWFRRVAAPLLTRLHRDGGLKKVELRS